MQNNILAGITTNNELYGVKIFLRSDVVLFSGFLALSQTESFILSKNRGFLDVDTTEIPETVTVEAEKYHFHTLVSGKDFVEKKLINYFIDKHVFDLLMHAWDNLHLKNVHSLSNPCLRTQLSVNAVENWINIKQDREAILTEHVNFLKNNGVLKNEN